MMKKTQAVLIEAGRPVAQTETTARGGDVVSYGKALRDGGIHEYGRAKVTRAKKYLGDGELIEALPSVDVNFGGGAPE